jgi:hypothetical protein
MRKSELECLIFICRARTKRDKRPLWPNTNTGQLRKSLMGSSLFMEINVCVFPGDQCLCISWGSMFVYFLGINVCVFPGDQCLCISWGSMFVYFMEINVCVFHGSPLPTNLHSHQHAFISL